MWMVQLRGMQGLGPDRVAGFADADNLEQPEIRELVQCEVRVEDVPLDIVRLDALDAENRPGQLVDVTFENKRVRVCGSLLTSAARSS